MFETGELLQYITNVNQRALETHQQCHPVGGVEHHFSSVANWPSAVPFVIPSFGFSLPAWEARSVPDLEHGVVVQGRLPSGSRITYLLAGPPGPQPAPPANGLMRLVQVLVWQQASPSHTPLIESHYVLPHRPRRGLGVFRMFGIHTVHSDGSTELHRSTMAIFPAVGG
jgi:hypothetical protein